MSHIPSLSFYFKLLFENDLRALPQTLHTYRVLHMGCTSGLLLHCATGGWTTGRVVGWAFREYECAQGTLSVVGESEQAESLQTQKVLVRQPVPRTELPFMAGPLVTLGYCCPLKLPACFARSRKFALFLRNFQNWEELAFSHGCMFCLTNRLTFEF